ncbi:MAG: hypothetical protein ACTTH7_09265 [Treponema sp.]
MPDSLIYKNPPPSFREVAFEVSRRLLGEQYDDSELSALIAESFPFRVSVSPIDPRTYVMDLTYGPSGTATDFAARFSVLLSTVSQQKPSLVILIGETDADIALARSFSCIENMYCIFLYPAEAFSKPYQQSMLRLSGTLQQVRVKGSLQECRQLQHQLYTDEVLNKKYTVIPYTNIDKACLISAAFCTIYAALTVLSRSSYDNTIENPRLIMSFSVNTYNMLSAAMLVRNMKVPIAGYIAVTDVGDSFDSSVFYNTASTQGVAYSADSLRRIKQLCGKQPITSDMLFYRLDPAWREKAIDNCNEKTGVMISRDGAALWHAWNDIRSGGVNTLKHTKQIAPFGVYGTERSIPYWAQADNYARSCMGVITEATHPALHAPLIKAAIGQEPPIPHRFEQFQCPFQPLEIEPDYSQLRDKIIHLL